MARVYDILWNAAQRWPQRVGVHTGEHSLTFAQLDAQADRLAGALCAARVGRGGRFALLSRNHPVFFTAQAAASRLGAILVPINTRLAPDEVAYIVDDSTPDVLLLEEGHDAVEAMVRARYPRLEIWPVSARDPVGPPSETRDVAAIGESALDPDAAAVLLYTSGTTGRPKGAIITNRALVARIHTYVLEAGMHHDCVFLQCLPMYHIAATISYAASYLGATGVVLEQFSAEGVDAAIRRHDVTHTILVPTMINDLVALAREPYPSVATVMYGAAPIHPRDLLRAMERLRCGFWQAFGQTETGPVTSLRPEQHDPVGDPRRLASAGQVAVGTEIAVVDEHGGRVPAGATGEILARGDGMMAGYWEREDDTAVALLGGWVHTGDAGHLDEDGYLYVTDRLKDMIISGGENVYPKEVERVLLDHCRPRLAGYKVPKAVTFRGELPRNATGKVLKNVLREQLAAGTPTQEGER